MLKYCKHLAAAFVACLVLVLLAQPAEAAGGQQGAFTYELKGNGTAVITKFDWSKHDGGDVYVPRMIDGYTVTEIGTSAFSDRSASQNLADKQRVNIVLPDTITVIAEKAFFETHITSCNIPSSVKFIGDGAFAGCSNISQFTVSSPNSTFAVIDGVLFNKVSKKLVAFPPAAQNKVYTIPNGIKTIGAYAFYETGISLTLPDTLVTIERYAFACSRSGKYVSLNHTSPLTIEIGDYAFHRCYVKFASSYTLYPKSIGSYAFEFSSIEVKEAGGFSFDKTIEMGEGCFSYSTIDPYNATINCFQTFSNSQISVIPARAFESAVMFYTVQLPSSIVEIGDYAFYYYNRGTFSISIPQGVKRIGSDAFSANDKGLIISFAEDAKLCEIGDRAFMGTIIRSNTFAVPDGVETIGTQAFFFDGEDISRFQKYQRERNITDNQYMSTLVIPDSVTSIGDEVVRRDLVILKVNPGSYADLWASENGYPVEADDTSWLFD